MKNKILMKKFLPVLVSISFLAALAVPLVVAAVTEPAEMTGQCTMRNDFSGWQNVTCPGENGICLFTDPINDCAMCCVLDTVYSVTNWIFVFVLALVVIFVLIGAVKILTASGNAEQVKSGRDYIIYAVVGAIVAALAKAIPAIVTSILGIS